MLVPKRDPNAVLHSTRANHAQFEEFIMAAYDMNYVQFRALTMKSPSPETITQAVIVMDFNWWLVHPVSLDIIKQINGLMPCDETQTQ